MNPYILFVDLPPAFVPLLGEVVKGGFQPLLFMGPLEERARAMGHCHLSFSDLAKEYLPDLVSEATQTIERGMDRAFEHPDVIELFRSPFGNFFDNEKRQFLGKLIKEPPEKILVSEAFDGFIQHNSLALIVFRTEDIPVQRTLARHAARHGIPTLEIAHGIHGKPLAPMAGELGRRPHSDHVAVSGRRALDLLAAQGFEQERIHITGSPFWDHFYDSSTRTDKETARRKLNLDVEKPVLLDCTPCARGGTALYSMAFQVSLAIHQTLIDALKRVGVDVQLVVQPHLSELARVETTQEEEEALLQLSRDWFVRNGLPSIHVSRGDGDAAILASDVVLAAGDSSITVEAMVLQRPVVMTSLIETDLSTFAEKDGLVVVNDLGELSQKLVSLVSNPSLRQQVVACQNEVLPELNFGNDGNALRRFTELVLNLAERTPGAGKLSAPQSREEGFETFVHEQGKSKQDSEFPTITGMRPSVAGLYITLACKHCQFHFESYQTMVAGVAVGRHICPECKSVHEMLPEHFQAVLDRFLPSRNMGEMIQLTEEASRVARTWYCDAPFADLLHYKGINLGEPTERELLSFIVSGLSEVFEKRKSSP